MLDDVGVALCVSILDRIREERGMFVRGNVVHDRLGHFLEIAECSDCGRITRGLSLVGGVRTFEVRRNCGSWC